MKDIKPRHMMALALAQREVADRLHKNEFANFPCQPALDIKDEAQRRNSMNLAVQQLYHVMASQSSFQRGHTTSEFNLTSSDEFSQQIV